MERIYLIPGTGVDRRLFSRLKLDGINVEFLEWIDPLPKEPLESAPAHGPLHTPVVPIDVANAVLFFSSVEAP